MTDVGAVCQHLPKFARFSRLVSLLTFKALNKRLSAVACKLWNVSKDSIRLHSYGRRLSLTVCESMMVPLRSAKATPIHLVLRSRWPLNSSVRILAPQSE